MLSDAEVRALIDAVGEPAFSRARNQALLAVLYRAGLRIAGALALLPKDLDRAGGSIRVNFGKGGRSRTVGVDPGAFALVDAWLVHRAALDLAAVAPLFCSRSGRAVTAAYMRRLLPELARRAGVQKRVHPHGFRHTHAAQLRGEGGGAASLRACTAIQALAPTCSGPRSRWVLATLTLPRETPWDIDPRASHGGARPFQ